MRINTSLNDILIHFCSKLFFLLEQFCAISACTSLTRVSHPAPARRAAGLSQFTGAAPRPPQLQEDINTTKWLSAQEGHLKVKNQIHNYYDTYTSSKYHTLHLALHPRPGI